MRPTGPSAGRRWLRVGAASAVALLVAASGWLGAATPAAAQGVTLTHTSVQITVLSVTPNSPLSTAVKRPLSFTVSVRNTTGDQLNDLVLSADRWDPIFTETALNAAIRNPPQPIYNAPRNPSPITVDLAGGQTKQVTFHTSTSTDSTSDAGICLCANAIYPIHFQVKYTGPDGSTQNIGSAQTYIPVSGGKAPPPPVQVAWVWPILDRPHRTTKDTVFIDDDLASEVTKGGRLEDLLEVVQAVAAQHVHMTLVLDPDLIDELQVMATEPYTVAVPGQAPVKGTGQAAAAAWLEQLRGALNTDPNLELDFTPFADPDVDALTQQGLTWTNNLGPQAQARITTALGGRTPPSDIAWPTGQTLQMNTLTQLAQQGTQTVILNDSTLRGHRKSDPQPNALAPIQTTAGSVLGAVTSAPIERYVGPVVRAGGPGLSQLPELVSEVAIRTVKSHHRKHFVVITPPRYVDPDPAVAARAILATVQTPWSQGIGLRAATSSVQAVDHGLLQPQLHQHELPAGTLAAAVYLKQSLPGLSSLFTNDTDATINLGPLPTAMQRAESAAWIQNDPDQSLADATALENRVHKLVDGVHLVRPSNGTYTLTSSNSPLPVTIVNTLNVTVSVKVAIDAVGGVPGFTADKLRTQTIAPHTTIQVRVPTHIERTGRIKVRATISTPAHLLLGKAVILSVHSTALGTVGVVITVIAGLVLVTALVVRFCRRILKRRRRRAVAAVPAPTP